MSSQEAYPGELRQTGLDGYSDEELLEAMLVDEVWTLHDIELLYGGLFNLATAVSDADTARYLTPSAANDWFGEDERVLILRFDFSDDKEPYKGLRVMAHGQSLVPKLAHSRYGASGVAKDHSITHMFKQKADPREIAVDRLTDWAVDSAVESVVSDEATDDAWVISRLAELGETDSVLNAIRDDIERIERGDGGLMTVQVKLSEDGDWLWPQEVDAFTEGMKRLQRRRMAEKNTDEPSVGHGVCFGTGDVGTVFGTTDDHLEMYKTRQFEKFPGNRPGRGWTTHPISLDAALDEAASKSFVEACQVRAFQGTVYHLPYFPGAVTADHLRSLFYALVELVRRNDEDGPNAPTARALEDIEDAYEDELRFYTLLIQKPQSSPWRTLGEMQNETRFPALDIAEAHDDLLETVWFDRENPLGFDAFDTSFFQRSGTLDSVASGWYLADTLPDRERHKNAQNKDIRPDDPRVRAFNMLLEGQPIDYDTLVSWYVERLQYVERGDVAEGSEDAYYREDDTGIEFPRWRIRRQFLQLCALANAGLVRTPDMVSAPTLDTLEYGGDAVTAETPARPTNGPQTSLNTFMPDTDPDTETNSSITEQDGERSVESRRERLTTFIDSHPPIRDDEEKRSSFLLGVLVGQLGGVQSRNVESTVVDSHPIASISKNNLHRVMTDVLHRNNIYAKKADTNSDRMFAEITEPLTDATLTRDPTDWSLTNEMVQFYYGLGIEWGKTHRGTGGESDESDDAADTDSELAAE